MLYSNVKPLQLYQNNIQIYLWKIIDKFMKTFFMVRLDAAKIIKVCNHSRTEHQGYSWFFWDSGIFFLCRIYVENDSANFTKIQSRLKSLKGSLTLASKLKFL